MDYVNLSDILDSVLPECDVEVPEWGGKVKVRALTSAEVSRCQRQSTDPRTGSEDGLELQARMVEAGCVEPKFAPGQYKVLMAKAPGPLNRIATRIMELSGLGDEEPDLGEA